MRNDYYVYIYWRLDTNEPFYVGKGHNDRWRKLFGRNKHFINIINKYPIVCEIVIDNLIESEAFYWEEEIIRILVFEYGFSIDILNNRSDEKGMHLANQTWGGEGTSGMNPYDMVDENKREEWKRKVGEAQKGEKHWNYGKHHSEETKEKMSKNHWSKKGIDSPFRGYHHTEQNKKFFSDFNKELYKNKENHPMYGKHHSDESKKKMSESHKGKNNSSSKSTICLTTKRIFYSASEGGRYYNCSPSSIAQCCNGKRYKSVGRLSDGTKLVWRWLIWNHNKIYRLSNN